MKRLGVLVSLTVSTAVNATSPGLFETKEEAVAFTALFGPGWQNPVVVNSGSIYGFYTTLLAFQLGDQKGYAAIGVDSNQKVGLYEVRFPIVRHKCVGAPNSRALARSLIDRFEPGHSQNTREVNRVGSAADIVWPYSGFPSGPGAQVGQTIFLFYKMNGYCSFRVLRSAVGRK